MEKLLEALSGVNVNLDTNSLVEIARYWFWKDVIEVIVRIGGGSILFLSFVCVGYKIIGNFGTGKWK